MKIPCLVLTLLIVFAFNATARVVFPDYESLSQKEQDAWGYKLDKSVGSDGYAFFELTIPPKAAKFFIDARLQIRDKQQRIQFTVDLGLYKGTDGSLHIRIERMQDSGAATLIVSTDELPDAPFHGDIGGFTFHIPPEPTHP